MGEYVQTTIKQIDGGILIFFKSYGQLALMKRQWFGIEDIFEGRKIFTEP